MVGVFLRLKLRLLANGFRVETSRLVGFILGGLFGVFFAGLACFGLIMLRGHPQIGPQIGVLVFTALALGWALLPLFLFGTDETLDPARLALFPLRRRTLITGLFAASLLGIPPLATSIVLAGTLVGLSGGPLSVIVGLVAIVLELALCIGLSRALTSALSGLLRSRRGRDLAIVFGVLLFLAFQGLNIAFQRGTVGSGDPQRVQGLLGTLAAPLRWTPSGTAAHAISDAATGNFVLALGELAITAVGVALVLWWWAASLGRALVGYDSSTQDAASQGSRQRPRLGDSIARVLPSGRLGAVAVKDLRYFWRDPQRKVGLIAAVGAAMILAFGGPGAESRVGVLLATCFAGVMLGLQAANQFGLDGPALWMNVVATASPRDLRTDIAGKHLAMAMVGAPILGAVSLVVGVLTGSTGAAVAAFALGCGVLGVSLGISTITSVLVPYPVPERAMNVFSSPGGGRGMIVGFTTLGMMLGSIVLAAPIVLPVILLFGGPVAVVLLVLAPVYGALAAWAGRRIATQIAFPRLPEMLGDVTMGKGA